MVKYNDDNKGFAWIEDSYLGELSNPQDMGVLVVNKKLNRQLENNTIDHEEIYKGKDNGKVAFLTIRDLLDCWNEKHNTEYIIKD